MSCFDCLNTLFPRAGFIRKFLTSNRITFYLDVDARLCSSIVYAEIEYGMRCHRAPHHVKNNKCEVFLLEPEYIFNAFHKHVRSTEAPAGAAAPHDTEEES